MKNETTPDARTRERVARLLLENGPATVGALSDRLGLTPAAVRRHLATLLSTGTVVARPPRRQAGRGRGRPARVFALSDAGHARMPNRYDDLAVAALRHLVRAGGEEAVRGFARARVAEQEDRYRAALGAGRPADRLRALGEQLSRDGYAASVAPSPAGTQLCQHHCPVQHVAEEFPQLCDAETELFARLLGTHVQRLATIAHGDGVCTTHVPRSARRPSRQPATGRITR